jgi:ferritin-like protein
MASSSQGYHEREELLPAKTKDLHRALVSLQEELEAVDWYQQRIDAVEDPELREILQHNRDEEIEHASMVIEWLRRHDPVFRRQLAMHTNHDGPIVSEDEEEEAAGSADAEGRAGKGSGEKPR